MFGVPVKTTLPNGDVFYSIDINVSPLGVEIEYNRSGLVYSKEAQSRFRTLQSLVISELAKEKSLFKNPPTQASLEAITPNWGFIASGSNFVFSPYAILLNSIEEDKLPCIVDIQLKTIQLSRSTIKPMFKIHYLGVKKDEVDFEWNDEIIEVSDVPSTADATVVTLADPVIARKEKEDAKAQVRAALIAAHEAQKNANALANAFYDKYDLSDSESAFTEWMSEDESDSE